MKHKISIFTPTYRYGGLDVNHASILKQEIFLDWDVKWIIADDLYMERREAVKYLTETDTYHFKPPNRRAGSYRNLAAAYNVGFMVAKEWGADVFVSMQDFMWLPSDGIKNFVLGLESLDMEHMITGSCSLTLDPTPDKVVEPKGLWSVFAEDYKEKPQIIKWRDCRLDLHQQRENCSPVEFETNWACWPMQEVLRQGIWYDERYDKGAAYENQDFAFKCLEAGIVPFIDPMNEALGLPHKAYWPEDEAEAIPYCESNFAFHQDKWEGKT